MANDFRFQISDCRLQIADCRFQISDCRLQISDFRFQISDFRSEICNRLLSKHPNPSLRFNLHHADLLKQPQVIRHVLDRNKPVRRCDVIANSLDAALAVDQVENLV